MDEHGEHLDSTKIQFIHDWISLTILIEICNFLILVNVYLKFLLWFSHITWPLRKVTKGGAKANFSWRELE